MRLYSTIRLLLVGAGVLILAVGVSGVLAQDAATTETPAPLQLTGGACPHGLSTQLLDQFLGSTGMATEEPGMQSTQDMTMTTPEATQQVTPGMNAENARCLFGWFSGAAEVPGPGDGDSFGVAFVSINPTTAEICYEVAVANITLPADAMHIHNAPMGESGDVVVPFTITPDASGMASQCFFMFDRYDLLADIVANPSSYYVNVHTSDFPDGATRAQLLDWDDTNLSDLGLTEMTPEAANG